MHILINDHFEEEKQNRQSYPHMRFCLYDVGIHLKIKTKLRYKDNKIRDDTGKTH